MSYILIQAVHASHVGKVRSINQDCATIQTLEHGYVLGIVADGMGGHLAGDTASDLAVKTLLYDIDHLDKNLSEAALSAVLNDAIAHANEVIYRTGVGNIEYHNMGTTVVAALFRKNKGIIGHIGDSRAYKINNYYITQLTEDHTLVNELFRTGQITAEDVAHHPRRNILTRALGTDVEVSIDMLSVALEQGDVLLLCSDGLTNMVSDEQIQQVAGNTSISLQERANLLIRLALSAGGDDNITVMLMELQNDDPTVKIEERCKL